jgi:surface protein
MRAMFSGCSALTDLKIRNFNTIKVTRMANMFRNCNSFQTLDLAHFKISQKTDMKYMFSGCSALKTLYLHQISPKVSTWGMFVGCNAQVIYK